jgi:hypothetical protein
MDTPDSLLTPLAATVSRPDRVFPTLTPTQIARIAPHGRRRAIAPTRAAVQTAGRLSGERKRSDGLLGESDHERRRSHQAPPVLHATAPLLDSTVTTSKPWDLTLSIHKNPSRISTSAEFDPVRNRRLCSAIE